MEMFEVKTALQSIRGKTIAIIYIFEKEDAKGFEHYWIWKSNIISGWLMAIQELNCIPYILDVRTFVHKAMDRSLPHLDYVLNLNCGSNKLSSMSLVPSVCSFLNIPCIPCNAVSIGVTENKHLSNLIAQSMNLNVPAYLNTQNENGIFRPINLGSSIGVIKGKINPNISQGIYQQFIPGYDITFPIVYNHIIQDLDVLPPIIYIPKSKDPNWIYNAEEKVKDNGFDTFPIMHISGELRKKLIEFAKVFPIESYGRIDARIKCSDIYLSHEILNHILSSSDVFFVEINSMPTIEREDSFEYAVNAASHDKNNSFFDLIAATKDVFANISINGFLLCCSMLALSTTMC